MKTVIVSALLTIAAATSAVAWSSTNCYNTFNGVTCNSYGGGGYSTTRCYQTYNGVRCNSY